MTAAITDLLTQATNGTRPSPTTLTAIHTNGQTTFTVNSLTGWPTATAVHFIVYTIDSTGAKIAGSQTDWKGIGNGTTSISSCVLKAGTDSGYSVGAVVECAPTAAWADDVVSWGTAQHTQLGAHTGITTDTLTATGVVNASTVSSLQDTGIALSTYRNETQTPFTASGGVWSGDAYASTKNASMTAWVGYINGQRGTIGAVTARGFTASKDTYVDVLNTAGVFTLVYTEVTNNAASPALAANSMRLAIVVTGASSIAAATSINQGSIAAALPTYTGTGTTAMSVCDSLGNLIYNTLPNPRIIGYRQVTSSQNIGGSAETDLTGLYVTVKIPTGAKAVTVSTELNANNSASPSRCQTNIKDGSTTYYKRWWIYRGDTNDYGISGSVTLNHTGTQTYKISLASNGGTDTMDASATQVAFIRVEVGY